MAKTQALAKSDENQSFLPVAFAEGPQALVQTIRENLGGERITPFDLTRIKCPAGGSVTWEIPTSDPDNPETAKQIQGVIIHHNLVRSFWAEEFGEGAGNKPPDCFSPDANFGQGDPHDGKGPRQGIECATCVNAQFGTAKRNGKLAEGQACRQMRMVFLLRPGQALPSLVVVTPGSLKVFRKFLLDLTSSMVPLDRIVVGLNLKKETSGGGIAYSQIIPSKVGDLTGEDAAKMTIYKRAMEPLLRSLDLKAATEGVYEAEQ